MISVKSYIKNDKIITSLDNIESNFLEYFIHFDNAKCLELVIDFDYMEGAIIINYYGNTILGFKEWDMIDQLWSYFINAIEELFENQNDVSFYFPDQSLEVKMQVISQEQILLSIAGEKTCFNKDELLLALLKGAENFFDILKECPDEYLVEQSNNELKRIEKLLNKLNI
ncbi:hypothetical protein [Bacillus wiedmannii]|uniref:Uncharacterized protein n=1 Tax=Bacillus wiedmannii TaxID=1890302 RepID=A0A2B6S775_9BACI|nr:hypothetical protein [Bacillus wiedmannii]MDF9661478.1 hypothetical protein [Bacillus wiedmannii]PGD36655.1 hypothetical protein COM27_11635 [Bacillus wiedmannii]